MQEAAVICKKIKKHYGDKETRIEALKGIDLEIRKKELTLLVGPSGSGKSTLLSIITTILTPDEGELYLLDRDISKMSHEEKAKFANENLGIVFQSLFLIPSLSVLENVALPLLVSGYSEREAESKSMDLLERFNLASRSNTSPSNLSKGQQQRIAIARAVVNNARILVCDEPTSSLDYHCGQEVMQLLKQLAIEDSSDHAKAVLVVTHDHRIFPFADRIVNMNDGQILEGEG